MKIGKIFFVDLANKYITKNFLILQLILMVHLLFNGNNPKIFKLKQLRGLKKKWGLIIIRKIELT